MSLNATPRGERTHIGIFGRTNAGKSSLMNALTGQEISIVSPVPGTTTDPVRKAMELLPLGPVVLIDTAGLDDESELGSLRTSSTKEILSKADIALLVADAYSEPSEYERELLSEAATAGRASLIALNKTDTGNGNTGSWEKVAEEFGVGLMTVSAVKKTGINDLKDRIASLLSVRNERMLVRDLVNKDEVCLLVVPIDGSAPKGRLILPQQQVIRDLLDCGALAVVVKDTGYENALSSLSKKPALVVTDSQVFGYVSERTPADIPLTSFSILFARYKGELDILSAGAKAVSGLKDGDRVLICEGCTHHRQCDDIGTVKIPKWLSGHTGKNLEYTFCSGSAFPSDLTRYALIVHCGGCMLNGREMQNRIDMAKKDGTPIVNYGVLIAHLNGILERCLSPFYWKNM